MPKAKEPSVELPIGWSLRLSDLVRARQKPNEHKTIHDHTSISPRALASARSSNRMTEKLFARLAGDLEFKRAADLLGFLRGEIEASRPATPIPNTLSLKRQKANPQG